jgi:hypothetical protein
MKVYISGKIGEEVISEATRQRFAKAEEMLKAKGYEVENPASENYQMAMGSWIESQELAYLFLCIPFNKLAEIMQYDFDKIKSCDAVYMLHHWVFSRGATLEYDFAEYIGVDILFQEADDAICYLERRLMKEIIANKESVDLDSKEYKKREREYVDEHLSEVWLPIE